jgi:glutamate-1-semialdehyde 2,1-aminomutase
MLTVFATDGPVHNFEEAQQADVERYAKGFRHLLANGIYFPPSQFESLFVSLVHTDEDIDRTIAVINEP